MLVERRIRNGLARNAGAVDPDVDQFLDTVQRRGRRRVIARRVAAGLAVAAAVAAGIAVGPQAMQAVRDLGHPAPAVRPGPKPGSLTVYVVSGGSRGGTVTPISTATGTPGAPIPVGPVSLFDGAQIAFTPGGTTAYVANFDAGTVTPVSTATNTAGPPNTPAGRQPRPDRHHAGREDRLHPERRRRHPSQHGHQHARPADLRRHQPLLRSRSRRTGRPSTSPTSTMARSHRSRPPPTRRASRSGSALSPRGDRDHAGREDRLRRGRRYGHPIARPPIRPAGRSTSWRWPQRDRDHAGREDRLHHRRVERLPVAPPPTRPASRSRSRHPRRSRSRRTGRPPTSSAAPSGNGHADRDRHQHAGEADQDRRQ